MGSALIAAEMAGLASLGCACTQAGAHADAGLAQCSHIAVDSAAHPIPVLSGTDPGPLAYVPMCDSDAAT